MAFPHDQDGAGDVKSLRRGAWYGFLGTSEYTAYGGGNQLAGAVPPIGHADYKWDQPEGWAPRITNHGTTEVPPFDHGTSHATSTCNFVYKEDLPNIERTDSDGNIALGTTGYVIELQNDRNLGQAVYTLPYGSTETYEGGSTYAAYLNDSVGRTPLYDGHWYLSWYGRKSSSPESAGLLRQVIYVFGTIYTDGVMRYNTGFEVDGGVAGGRALDDPKYSGTFYRSSTETLTTDWQKFDMCFKFSGSAGIPNFMNLRLDSWDGNNSIGDHSTCYFDRITLHPLNISLSSSRVDSSGPPYKMSDITYGSY